MDSKYCFNIRPAGKHRNYVKNIALTMSTIGKSRHILDHKLLRTALQPSITMFELLCGNMGQRLQIQLTAIMHATKKMAYLEHTNSLFLNSQLQKFTDVVKFRTAQILFKARQNLLRDNKEKCLRKDSLSHL